MRRRDFLTVAAGAGALAAAEAATRFEIACMTLPYSAFPMERALTGIQGAGYRYVAWGVNHRDAAGVARPMLAVDAPPAAAASLAGRCRDVGLEPVMMFATVHLEAASALEAHLRRIDQAAAAKIPFLLTFGRTAAGEYESVIRHLKGMAEPARKAGVTVVIKQHGGNTGTGEACARIIREVGEPAVRMCYDAGNVLDYAGKDAIADIRACWRDVRAFAIKDHRMTPKSEDCGPGFGEIDHYKLLAPVTRTGLRMPLACENIFEPLVARPAQPEGVDALARRAREYLESVLRGLENHARGS
jgi:sugar phosphate isomerase/epimerase